jgi:hypothetical protein
MAQQQKNDVPFAQAEAAYHAALRFQAQRQYQQDLASGMAPSEALAKSAPLIFSTPKPQSLSGVASLIKATTKPTRKVMDVGGVLYEVPSEGPPTALTQPKATTQKLDPVDTAMLKSDMEKLKEIEGEISTTPEGEKRDNLVRQWHDTKNQITIRYRKPNAPTTATRTQAPPPTATPKIAPPPASKRVKVIGPSGKRGTVPAGTALPDGWKLAE